MGRDLTSNLSLDKDEVLVQSTYKNKDEVLVQSTYKNYWCQQGEEVLQLYISDFNMNNLISGQFPNPHFTPRPTGICIIAQLTLSFPFDLGNY